MLRIDTQQEFEQMSVAAVHDDIATISMLVARGIDPNRPSTEKIVPTNYGDLANPRPIEVAVISGSLEAVMHLYALGARIANEKNVPGTSTFLRAICQCELPAARYYVLRWLLENDRYLELNQNATTHDHVTKDQLLAALGREYKSTNKVNFGSVYKSTDWYFLTSGFGVSRDCTQLAKVELSLNLVYELINQQWWRLLEKWLEARSKEPLSEIDAQCGTVLSDLIWKIAYAITYINPADVKGVERLVNIIMLLMKRFSTVRVDLNYISPMMPLHWLVGLSPKNTLANILATCRKFDVIDYVFSKTNQFVDLNSAPPDSVDAGVTLGWLLCFDNQYKLFNKLILRAKEAGQIINLNAAPLHPDHRYKDFTIAALHLKALAKAEENINAKKSAEPSAVKKTATAPAQPVVKAAAKPKDKVIPAQPVVVLPQRTEKTVVTLEDKLKANLAVLTTGFQIEAELKDKCLTLKGRTDSLHAAWRVIKLHNKNKITGPKDEAGETLLTIHGSVGALNSLFELPNLIRDLNKLIEQRIKQTADKKPAAKPAEVAKPVEARAATPVVENNLTTKQRDEWQEAIAAIFCQVVGLQIVWNAEQNAFTITYPGFDRLWQIRRNESHAGVIVPVTPDLIEQLVVKRVIKCFQRDSKAKVQHDAIAKTIIIKPGNQSVASVIKYRNKIFEKLSEQTQAPLKVNAAPLLFAVPAKSKAVPSLVPPVKEEFKSASIDTLKQLFAAISGHDAFAFLTFKSAGSIISFYYRLNAVQYVDQFESQAFFDAVAQTINSIVPNCLSDSKITDGESWRTIKLSEKTAEQLLIRKDELHAVFMGICPVGLHVHRDAQREEGVMSVGDIRQLPSKKAAVLEEVVAKPVEVAKPLSKSEQLFKVSQSCSSEEKRNLLLHMKKLDSIMAAKITNKEEACIRDFAYLIHALRFFMTIAYIARRMGYEDFYKYRLLIRHAYRTLNWEVLQNAIRALVDSIRPLLQDGVRLALFMPAKVQISDDIFVKLQLALEPFEQALQAKKLGKMPVEERIEKKKQYETLLTVISNTKTDLTEMKQDALLMIASLADKYSAKGKKIGLNRSLGHRGLNTDFNTFTAELHRTATTRFGI